MLPCTIAANLKNLDLVFVSLAIFVVDDGCKRHLEHSGAWIRHDPVIAEITESSFHLFLLS